MRETENANRVADLGISMMGFIFFERSARFVSGEAPQTPDGIERVGVFVNATKGYILEKAKCNSLSYIQLHGSESVELCRELRKLGFGVIKAISVASPADMECANEYDGEADFLLFDTKCAEHGGSGRRFDWSILDCYKGATKFLLSGGIDENMVYDILQITHPQFFGVDLNSRFEDFPAMKNIAKLKMFIEKLKNKDMNRIDKLFADKGNNILSVYYPAGFPRLEDTMPILAELQSQGVDMVELGVPFSDPMADGVVIQQASTKALENGMSLKKLFAQIENMRTDISIPVLLMGYLNPIMHYGFEAFCADCKRVGVDGMIIPDLPFKEYMAEFKDIAEKYELKVVMFISPETSEERIRLIDTHASGFIYMVSCAGTTGARGELAGVSDGYFERVNGMGLQHPRLIGFGVSNKATFDSAVAASSGAIVGSHFVKLLDSCDTAKEAVSKLLSDIGR